MPSKTSKGQRRMPEFAATTGPALSRTGGRQDGGSQDRARAEPDASSEGQGTPEQPLEEIRRMLVEVIAAIGGLTERLDAAQAAATTQAQRLTEAETRVGAIEDRMAPLQARVDALERQLGAANRRLEDQEGRSRRANVRILGIPEGAEGNAPETFIEKLIREVLPSARLSSVFIVERAHRALTAQPPVGAPPRSFIAKILNFRDRDAILRAAREAMQVQYGAGRLSFYPDYTQAVQTMRKKFDAAKCALRDRGVKYAILHPAKLRFIHNNRAHFYTDCEKALEYIEHNMGRPSHRNGSSRRSTPRHDSPSGTDGLSGATPSISRNPEAPAHNCTTTPPGTPNVIDNGRLAWMSRSPPPLPQCSDGSRSPLPATPEAMA